ITMSIVTRSGLSCRYFSTAWVPVSASPTTSNPACARMSVIIVRMKMASSQTRTVWLTARSLSSQDRAQQCRDVQHDEHITAGAPPPPPPPPYQRGIRPGEPPPPFRRRIAPTRQVGHLVAPKASHLAGVAPVIRL